MSKILTYIKTAVFIFAIILGCIIQIMIYLITPLSAGGMDLQNLLVAFFYVPMFLLLITFPRPKSVRWQMISINILIFCLVLATMHVDYQVLRIFSLLDTLPPDIGTLVWDKTHNLYWAAWALQMSIIFLTFALIYRFVKDDTWTAFRIGLVGPLITLFSFEDLLYYPMHGENPFTIIAWSWLGQHDNLYTGRSINTFELFLIVVQGICLAFVLLIGFAIRKKPEEENLKHFSTPKEKTVFQWSTPVLIGAFVVFILLYLVTNIINDQIPFYLLLFFAGIVIIFIIFSSYFPKIKNPLRQLVLIFIIFIIFWIVATEMDWHAVEAGFHWILPLDPRKPPGDFWVWCNYRMAMWLIYVPVVLLLISVMFKFLGNSRENTLTLGITNFLILFMGIDSILMFFLAGFAFPPHWAWSNVYYSIFGVIYSIPVLIGFAIGISALLIYLHRKNFSKEKRIDEKD